MNWFIAHSDRIRRGLTISSASSREIFEIGKQRFHPRLKVSELDVPSLNGVPSEVTQLETVGIVWFLEDYLRQFMEVVIGEPLSSFLHLSLCLESALVGFHGYRIYHIMI